MSVNKKVSKLQNMVTRINKNNSGYEEYFEEKGSKIELRPDIYDIAQECLKVSFIKLGMIAGGNMRESNGRFESTDFLAAKELAKLSVELLKVCGNKPRKKDDEKKVGGSWDF